MRSFNYRITVSARISHITPFLGGIETIWFDKYLKKKTKDMIEDSIFFNFNHNRCVL